MPASNDPRLPILVAAPERGGPYHITTGGPNPQHVQHVLHACEKRLRDCDAADAQNPHPQPPRENACRGSLLADQWQPSPEELAVHLGKKALIDDTRASALIKRDHALALLRQTTHPGLLHDDIFSDFDLDAAWAARPSPPKITRQPGTFLPTRGGGPPVDPGSPPAPDKVELMNAHYAEQQSLLANPLPRPGPRAV